MISAPTRRTGPARGAPDYVAASMTVDRGAEAVVRRRLLSDGTTGHPEEVRASYLPAAIVGDKCLEEPTVVPQALFPRVEDLTGKRYAFARDRWVAPSATPAEAPALDLSPGSPVMHLIHAAEASGTRSLGVRLACR